MRNLDELLIIDCILVLFMAIKYIPRWIKRVWNLFTGNKGAIQKVLDML